MARFSRTRITYSIHILTSFLISIKSINHKKLYNISFNGLRIVYYAYELLIGLSQRGP